MGLTNRDFNRMTKYNELQQTFYNSSLQLLPLLKVKKSRQKKIDEVLFKIKCEQKLFKTDEEIKYFCCVLMAFL